MLKPTFVIVGAQKCGTDSLYSYLAAHPEAAMSHPKEPHFFSRDAKGVDWQWYQHCFSSISDAKVFGEASASYLAVEGVASHMLERLGNKVKLLFILRNPVERIYSAFLHMRKTRPFFDRRSFDEAVAWQGKSVEALVEEERRRIERARREGTIDVQSFADFGSAADWNYRYIKNSVYRPQIGDFLRHFPRENCLFLLLDDLRLDWRKTAQTVFAYLDIDPAVANTVETAERNVTKMPRTNFFGRALSYRCIRNAARGLLRPRQVERVKRLLVGIATSQPALMPAEVRQHLSKVFMPENEALSHLIGLDLSRWNPSG